MQGGVKYSDGENVTVVCHECGGASSHSMVEVTVSYREEHGQFDNVAVECPLCTKEGKSVTVFINLNIPEFEEDEIYESEVFMDLPERNSRAFVRKIMWSKRPDLKTKDFEKEREKHAKKHSDRIKNDRTRAAKERSRLRGN